MLLEFPAVRYRLPAIDGLPETKVLSNLDEIRVIRPFVTFVIKVHGSEWRLNLITQIEAFLRVNCVGLRMDNRNRDG